MRQQIQLNQVRRGGVTLLALILLTLLLAAVGLALYVCQYVEARTQLQNAADATALAAIQELVDDRMLLDSALVVRKLLLQGRQQAQTYHEANSLRQAGPQLDLNVPNRPKGDVVYGVMENPLAADFVAANLAREQEEFLPLINAVRITVPRTEARGSTLAFLGGPFLSSVETELTGSATAMLDRRVFGFRPVFDQPLPLVPIALFSDLRGEVEESWEFQVEKRRGTDQFSYDAEKRTINEQQPDGLFEMRVQLGGMREDKGKGKDKDKDKDEESAQQNACFLQIGTSSTADWLRQVELGVSPEDLKNLGDEFVLGADQRLLVPGSPWSAPGNAMTRRVQQTLTQWRDRAEPRIWPLFRGFDVETGFPVITGFVAARVVAVAEPKEDGIRFLLQPASISTPTVVTESQQEKPGGVAANRYICKVRLVR